MEPDFIKSEREADFIRYVSEVFIAPIYFENKVRVPSFLKSKLEGTEYLSINGEQINHDKLIKDISDYYSDFENQGSTDKYRLKHIFGGFNTDFYEICQVAYFLKITVEELISPSLPEHSQSDEFYEQVKRLHKEGLSYKTISGRYNVNQEALIKRISGNEKKPVNRGSASMKGVQKIDWDAMDVDILPKVREACSKIFYDATKGPKRVTFNGVTTMLGIPHHRIKYLPKCRREVEKYAEVQEEYWARKLIWAYRKLLNEGHSHIAYHPDMFLTTHVSRKDIRKCVPFLPKHCKPQELHAIMEIIQL